MSHYQMNFRRQRQSKLVRNLMGQTTIQAHNLITPFFIDANIKEETPLQGLTGVSRHTIESAKVAIQRHLKAGLSSVLIFIVPPMKGCGKDTPFNFDYDQKVIKELRQSFGNDILLMVDLCLCSHTQSGHCGILDQCGGVENDLSVAALTERALLLAQSGADVISPSDMMDGRIASIRECLNAHKLDRTMIMSYSSKFASAFYGPFREAADSTPQQGDRKSYQIDPRNSSDAIRSSLRDLKEGADILMVKPSTLYTDIIYQIKHHPETNRIPVAAYHISGEYQSLKVMHEKNLINFSDAYLETLIALRRAGSDMIITYGSLEATHIIKDLL